jgi:hypothetical protein
LGSQSLSKKMNLNEKEFWEDLTLLIIKNHLLMQFVESVWLKRFTMHLCSRLLFPSRKKKIQEVLLELVEKCK